jgi:glycine/D-amino acid oxidase-like deaminating enzyme
VSNSLRIVGQGLAGSLLGWACERSGLPFEIIDAGHASASSRIGAGIINPITGQRIVKSWRIDELLPKAVETYREIETALGEELLFPMRVRRFCRNESERDMARRKHARGELAPYVVSIDDDAFWIESAYRVDTTCLIERLRQRWISSDKLIEREVTSDALQNDGRLTVWCTGAGELKSQRFGFAKLSPAKGEILEVACGKLDTRVILNDGHWVLPLGGEKARVGATFQWAFGGLEPTLEAREALIASATRLVGGKFEVTGQEVGIRITTLDKHPVIGHHPQEREHGIFNGLGSKGALLAPWLADQWITHLTTGAAFDESVDVERFSR